MTCSAARNGASSSTYITARAKNDATSASAPTTGFRCRTTTSEKITATAAKKKKMANSNMVTRLRGYAVARWKTRSSAKPRNRVSEHPFFSYPMLRDKESDDDDIHERQRQEHLPAEAHQDVVFEPGDGPADPDEDQQQDR